MAVTYVDEIPIGFGLVSNALVQQAMLIPALVPSSQKPENNTKASIDPDILEIEQVAQILRCGIDKVRRIPRSHLPARKGPGKKLLYLRQDVLNYVLSLPAGNEHREVNSLASRSTDSNNFSIEDAMAELSKGAL